MLSPNHGLVSSRLTYVKDEFMAQKYLSVLIKLFAKTLIAN